MTIKEQQAIAREVLSQIRGLDPLACICGGAPRDWYLGNEASDIDVYLRTFFYKGGNTDSLQKAIQGLFPDCEVVKKEGQAPTPKQPPFQPSVDYTKIQGMVAVFGLNYKGIGIDFICLENGFHPESIYHDFDSSICKVRWDDKIGHREFVWGYQSFESYKPPTRGGRYVPDDKLTNEKRIVWIKGVRENHKHFKKMFEKFPPCEGWTHILNCGKIVEAAKDNPYVPATPIINETIQKVEIKEYDAIPF
jgi:hypothetical protein